MTTAISKTCCKCGSRAHGYHRDCRGQPLWYCLDHFPRPRARPRTCAECGQTFRTNTKSAYCSVTCRALARARTNAGKPHPCARLGLTRLPDVLPLPDHYDDMPLPEPEPETGLLTAADRERLARRPARAVARVRAWQREEGRA